MVERSRSDNLTKVIMEPLMIGGHLLKDQNAHKLICFRVDGVNVFHGTNNGVTKQIKDNYIPHFLRVHCMAHHTNLVVQTLSEFPLVISLKNILQTLHFYFAPSIKRHLEFIKLAKLVQTKRNKIIQNAKTRWISMLNLIKLRMMA
jgi:hypothetical protein